MSNRQRQGPMKPTLSPEAKERIARCDREIKRIRDEGPHDPLWYAVVGEADWEAEKYLIEEEAMSEDKLERYLKFLESKAVIAQPRGLADPGPMNPNLKPHAAEIAAWMIRGGAQRWRFAAFGLHKTSIQLQILETLVGTPETAESSRPSDSGLVICPLGVKHEFVREAKQRKFSFVPVYVRTNEELEELQAKGHRHFLTNYERVRDGNLDPNRFKVVSLDEAAVLRSFGSKTYQTFLALFDKVPFKFVATATPDPNRHKELIHYAGFLGIMDTGQALTRFFKRDPTQAQATYNYTSIRKRNFGCGFRPGRFH